MAVSPVFGFINAQTYQDLTSPDFETRLPAAQMVALNTKGISVIGIDVSGFFKFAKDYFLDENYGVIASFSEIFDSFLSSLGSCASRYFEEFMDATTPPLGDGRRAVRMLANSLIVRFAEETSNFRCLERLIANYEWQNVNAQTEIFEIALKMLSKLRPDPSVFPGIASILEMAFLTVNVPLHSAASRVLRLMNEIDREIFDRLPPGYQKYLDTGDNPVFKGPMRGANTAKIPIPTLPKAPWMPRAHNMSPKPPSAANIKKVQRTDDFWYKSKPRLSKTAGLLLGQPPPTSFTPQPQKVGIFSRTQMLPQEIFREPEPHYQKMDIMDDDTPPRGEEAYKPLENLTFQEERPRDNHTWQEERPLDNLTFPEEKPREIPRRAKPFAQTAPIPIPVQAEASQEEEDDKDEDVPFDERPIPKLEGQAAPSWFDGDQLPPRLKPVPVNKPVRTRGSLPAMPRRSKFNETMPVGDLPIVKGKFGSARVLKMQVTSAKPNISQTSRQTSTIDTIMEDLKSPDWEKQNNALATLTSMLEKDPSVIGNNLRVVVMDVVEIAPSIRSTLSKTALTCLCKLAEAHGADFTPFFEAVVNDLLQILLSSKAFITNLAGECISTIMRKINRKKALEFLAGDHKKRAGPCRAHLALCLEELCCDCDDPTPILKSLGSFVTDASPETRKHARAALLLLEKKFPDLKATASSAITDESEKMAVMSILSG